MTDFKSTHLWKRTLDRRTDDPHSNERARLRIAFELFRERAGIVAEEIKRSYPSLTEHGLTHLDSLWEMADLIIGEDYPVNSAEAFVLGGAFLIHDLGNGLAAFPGKEEDLRATPEWRDAYSVWFRREHYATPVSEDFNEPQLDIARRATEDALRVLHARQAERLALIAWTDQQGEKHHLLEDSSLRSHFGKIIGEIALSHWWDISEVELKFNRRQLGAATFTPPDWSVDVLKLACILRAADAAHIDNRRAPAFLMTLRAPEGVSKQHWTFQHKISKPLVQHSRLVYSAGDPFRQDESNAFWLCFETLRMIDRELHGVDSLLAESNRQRFRVIGVAGIENAARLSEAYIATDGWTPVDAQVHIADVPSIIQKLGGYELYGDEPTVPFRELLQNAADAVRARRAIENRPPDWGAITISHGQDPHGTWIEFEDTGIGMSEHVLTRYLLNFGTSYWWSEDMRRERPGLAASKFEPTGKFGIGFFSAFMWGHHIRVTSCPSVEGATTHVLEFNQGLHVRPLLRKAVSSERISGGGTRIRVWFAEEETFKDLLKNKSERFASTDRALSLEALTPLIAPALDVTINISTPRKLLLTAVKANDWKTISPGRLLKRTESAASKHLAQFVRPIIDAQGVQTGRACICSGGGAIASVGGLRTGESIPRIAGVILCNTDAMRRDEACVLADDDTLINWATEQAKLWEKAAAEGNIIRRSGELMSVAHTVVDLGGNPQGLPLAWLNGNEIELVALDEWARSRNSVSIAILRGKDLFKTVNDELLVQASRHFPEYIFVPSGYEGGCFISGLFYNVSHPKISEAGPARVAGCVSTIWSLPLGNVRAQLELLSLPSEIAKHVDYGAIWRLEKLPTGKPSRK